MSGAISATSVAAAASVASVGIGAVGAIQQGNAQAAAARYSAQVAANNAIIANQNATFAAQEGEANAGAEGMKTRATAGAIKTNQAAGGIDVHSGSAVDTQASQAEIGQLNALTIRSNAARKAYGYQTEASSDTAQSQLDTSQAKNDRTAGVLKAGTTILGAAANPNANWNNFLGGNSFDSSNANLISNATTA